jgi:hypothetical protein
MNDVAPETGDAGPRFKAPDDMEAAAAELWRRLPTPLASLKAIEDAKRVSRALLAKEVTI